MNTRASILLAAVLSFLVGVSESTVAQEFDVPYTFSASFSTVEGQRIGRLDVTLTIEEGWHGYSQNDLAGQTATRITVSENPAIKKVGAFSPDQLPHPATTNLGPVEQFDSMVTWSAEVEFNDGFDDETVEIEVTVEGQVCNETACTQFDPNDSVVIASFSGRSLSKDEVPASGLVSPSVAVVSLPQLSTYLVMAFFAGLILNAMPCVLPVIGLKVLSFVKQSGESRAKVLMLNLAFAGGLMVVFFAIATLAAFFGMGWGDWMTKSISGSIVITSVVFAFGLSMLGVWEIPIPGLSSSGKEDGLSGAFLLGILTTVLATPCTGPLLVPATAIVAGQPVWVAYSVFMVLGLGMAVPYLIIGVFPSLISWLPKPGKWMDTFKQITGFILMGTVVFLLAGFGHEPHSKYLVATLATLLFIGFGCWWIGSSSYATSARSRRLGWFWGLSIIASGAATSYFLLGPPYFELEWKSFSETEIERYHEEGRFVFVDFTGPS